MLIEDIREDEWLAQICQENLPWSLRPVGLAVVGTAVLPVGANQRRGTGEEAPIGSYPRDWKKWLATRAAVPMQRPTFADLRAAASTWLTHIAPGIDMLGDTTTLTRVLSVLGEVTLPGAHPGAAYNDYARGLLGMCVVPRGNLDTLLWIGWRLACAFAQRVQTNTETLQRATTVEEVDKGIEQATLGMGICPAYDFGRTAAGETEDGQDNPEGVALWPGSWATRIAEQAVRQMTRATRSAHALDARRARMMAYGMRIVPQEEKRAKRGKDKAETLVYNLFMYRHACAEILEAVITALRVCGHAAARSRQFLHPNDSGLGPPSIATQRGRTVEARVNAWARQMTCVKALAATDQHALDHHFPVAFEESGIPFEWLVYCEADLWRRWQRMAWVGTALAWGVLPGDIDSPRFCGPYQPADAPLFIPDQYYGQAIKIEIPANYEQPLMRALLERAAAGGRAETEPAQ